MRTWWMLMTETGTRLELRGAPVPQPGPGQLLVRVQAASLNRGEFVVGHGLHGKAGSWKAIGGEAAGEVVETGEGVDGWHVGDRVMGRCPGGFSDYALIDIAEAIPVPPNLSWEEAASIPLAYLVTFDMLVLQGRLQAGEWLMINGVSSGVGVAALQLGKVLGAHVIGTSGSAAKLAQLTALGLDVGLETRAADFSAAVLRATDLRGADVFVNTVGGSVFAENIRCAAFEARLATVGYLDGVLEVPLDLNAVHAQRLTLFGVSNKLRSKAQRAAAVPRFTAEVVPLFAEGRIRPQVDIVYDFDQLPAAKTRMETGGHIGKIVLRVTTDQNSSQETK